MKRIYLLLMLLCLGVASSYGQSKRQSLQLPHNGYDLKLPEGPVHFGFDDTKVIISFKQGTDVQAFFREKAFFGKYDKSWKVPFPAVYRATLSIPAGSSYDAVITQIKASATVAYVAPVVKYKNLEQSVYDLFYVKLKKGGSKSVLDEKATALGFRIEKEYTHNVYFCRVDKNSAGNAFEMAARLQSLNVFEYAEPDFIYTCSPATTDPAFVDQWAINNTGQYNGIPGADMNVDQAWGITTGVSTIKVAIIDCFGSTAQFTHPDITFDATYDATGTGFNSSGFTGDAHGICCAGCVKATANNNLGGAGIAYNAGVVAVKVGTIINSSGNWNSTGNSISDGIIWAYQNTDVISNSNTFGSSSALINTAITDGLTLGRAGKGTLTFSSSGNSNSTTLGYPASYADGIAVGATSPCDERKNPGSCDGEGWGSNYGTGIDIGAPGVKIHTTDLPGAPGYSTTDYAPTFNGTSSACPNAAAVMALILSASPNLTATAARNVIESTCAKVGGYTYTANTSGQPNGTWSNDLGYGRVDAFAALQSLTPCAGTPAAAVISGPMPVCANAPFTINATSYSTEGGIGYQWQSSVTGSSSWTNVTGATDPNYTSATGISSSLYYRLRTRCANSSLFSYSNVVNVQVTTICYCIPKAGVTDELITNVTTAGINNNSTGFGTAGYQDFTSIVGNMQTGSTYPFNASISPFYSGDAITVWIDYNQDGVFTIPDEQAFTAAATSSAFTSSITVPTTATSGNTRMRVRLTYNVAAPDPCDSVQYGNTEDYTINIQGATCIPEVTIAASATSICSGASVTFTATPVNGGTAPTYQWKRNSTNVGTNSPTYTATNLTNGNVITCIMTSNAICATPNKDTSNAITMTVSPSVTPTITVTQTPASGVCIGSPVTFDANTTNTGGGVTEWYLNGNFVQISASYTLANPVNGDQVYAIAYSNAPCATVASVTSATKTVTVYALPSAVIATPSSTTLCPGDTITLTGTNGASYTYQWSVGGVAIPGATNNTYKVTAAGSYTITTTRNGCSKTSTARVISNNTNCNTATATITSVNPALNLCRGGNVTIDYTTTGTFAAGNQFIAQLSGTSGSFSTVVNLDTLTATGSGTLTGTLSTTQALGSGYRIRIISTNPAMICDTTNNAFTMNSVPTVAVVTITASGTNLCPGQTTVLLTVPVNTGYTYQWYLNGNAIPGTNNDSLVATAVGGYSVEAFNASGCGKMSYVKNIVAGTNCGASAAVITTTGTQTKCAGQTVTIAYTASGFTAGNVFTLQLSNSAGSFATPIAIGTVAAVSSGNITGTIPDSTLAGTGYKLRIVSSAPATTGAVSPLTLIIKAAITQPADICAVTVDVATGKNLITWNKPVTTNIDSFEIWRGTTVKDEYVKIGTQPYAAYSTYLDTAAIANPNKKSYRYGIFAKNSCGSSPYANIHTTVHLTINKGRNNNTWNLIWNSYEGTTYTSYRIWRGTSPTNMVVIDSVEGKAFYSDNSYTDETATTTSTYYRVTLKGAPVCNPTAKTTADAEGDVGSNIRSTMDEVMPNANWADMSVWPNPASAEASILIQSSNADQMFTVRIMDAAGRIVELHNDVQTGIRSTFGSALATGMYTIEAVSSNGTRVIQKWTKQ